MNNQERRRVDQGEIERDENKQVKWNCEDNINYGRESRLWIKAGRKIEHVWYELYSFMFIIFTAFSLAVVIGIWGEMLTY